MTSYNPETSILDEDKHSSLIASFEYYANLSGLKDNNARYIYETAEGEITSKALKYCKNLETLNSKGFYGGIFHSDRAAGSTMSEHEAQKQCLMVTGLLVRNFRDARLFTQNDLLEAMKLNGNTDWQKPSILVCPDFLSTDKGLTDYKISCLKQMLTHRVTNGKQTIVYLNSLIIASELIGYPLITSTNEPVFLDLT